MKKFIIVSLSLMLMLSSAAVSYAGNFNQMLAKKAYQALNPRHVSSKPNAVGVVGVPQIMAPVLYKEYIRIDYPCNSLKLEVQAYLEPYRDACL